MWLTFNTSLTPINTSVLKNFRKSHKIWCLQEKLNDEFKDSGFAVMVILTQSALNILDNYNFRNNLTNLQQFANLMVLQKARFIQIGVVDHIMSCACTDQQTYIHPCKKHFFLVFVGA